MLVSTAWSANPEPKSIDLDELIQNTIESIDQIKTTRNTRKISADIIFLQKKGIEILLRAESAAKKGQLYKAVLAQKLHVEVTAKRDHLIIDNIQGLTFYMKLPAFPDAVLLKAIELELGAQTIRIEARVLGGALKIVGSADLQTRNWDGVNWLETLISNLPHLLTTFQFN
jgi:hypothetical protein